MKERYLYYSQMEFEDPLFLIKFLDEPYADLLLKQGEMFLRPVEEFRSVKDNIERGDSLEGAQSNVYMVKPTITLTPVGQTEGKTLNVLHANINNLLDVNAWRSYSLFSVNRSDFRESNIIKLKQNNRQLGNKFILFRNSFEFMKRTVDYLNMHNYYFEHGPISYYDPQVKYDKLTLFHKRDIFEHQKEYRLLVARHEGGPLKFRIGSLEDIASVYDSELIDTMQVELSGNKVVIHFENMG